MTELEIVLLWAVAILVGLHFWQRAAIRQLRHIIIDVGLKEARIEVNEENHTVRIVRN